MKVTLDIPRKYEVEFCSDRFNHFFSRVITDMDCDGECGLHEREIGCLLMDAFDKAVVAETVRQSDSAASYVPEDTKLTELFAKSIQLLKDIQQSCDEIANKIEWSR